MNNDNAIYLGDIDPNNNILPVMTIRRIIMFQLLIWDKIILSDSQFLTDPRLNILMSGYTENEVSKKYNIDDIPDQLKGIETLFENGFIEVALRQNNDHGSSLYNTWNGMKRSPKSVPYLPEDENYVKYLSSFNYNTHIYQTNNMGSMFQEKLLRGMEADPNNGGIIFKKNDPTDHELIRMFNERVPLFRNMLDFLRSQQDNGKINSKRYTELYDYIYSCYNVNVSETLHCNINTKFSHIPFHIESGEEFWGNNPTANQVDKLRPTWVLNPTFLDHLTFDEFLEIRKHLKTSKIREFYLGNVKSSWADIEDSWDDYTHYLEKEIKSIFYEKKEHLNTILFDEFGVNKFLAKPQQKSVTGPAVEIVKSLVSFCPGISEITGAADSAKTIFGAVVSLSRRNQKILLAEEYNRISTIVSKEKRVVTKY